MRWHRFLKWRCKCGQKNSADQSLRNFGNCFHLTLAVENFEDVVERIGLIFVLSLFLGLFLVEVERRKTGSSLTSGPLWLMPACAQRAIALLIAAELAMKV